jgi:LuxR family quorum sensing-dependent transcriptional regulator
MDYSKAFTFIEGLDRLSSVDDVMDAMQRTLGSFGFEFFALFAVPRPGQRLEDVRLAIRLPPELLKIALEEQYIQVSPAVRHCRRTVHPFEWKSAPYDPEREPRAAEFVHLMTEFGLLNGIAVPIPSPTGCEGMVWLGGQRQELTACNMPMIHLMALYAFERIRRLVNRMPSAEANLTLREREVLTWVAVGKSAWEIGEILDIAKRTVDEHTQTAMHKLGAVNRTQAVALALRDRLIAP